MQPKSPMMKYRYGGSFQLYFDTIKNEMGSKETGSPKFDKVLMAEIFSPGSGNTVVPVEIERTTWDNRTITRLWTDNSSGGMGMTTQRERFNPGLDMWEKKVVSLAVTGMPLEHWGAIDIHWVATLKAQGVHTVESLAEVADSHLQTGWREWRERAKLYLDEAKGFAPIAALQTKVETMESENAVLKQQLADLIAQSTERRGPGRPRKEDAA